MQSLDPQRQTGEEPWDTFGASVNLRSLSCRQRYGRSDIFSSDGSRTLHPDGHSGNYVRTELPVWEHSPGGSV